MKEWKSLKEEILFRWTFVFITCFLSRKRSNICIFCSCKIAHKWKIRACNCTKMQTHTHTFHLLRHLSAFCRSFCGTAYKLVEREWVDVRKRYYCIRKCKIKLKRSSGCLLPLPTIIHRHIVKLHRQQEQQQQQQQQYQKMLITGRVWETHYATEYAYTLLNSLIL